MYMSRELIDSDNHKYPMTGVFPATIIMNKRLFRLGYQEATLTEDCLLGEAGDKLYGHEFHYSCVQEMDSDVAKVFRLQDGRLEGYKINNALGGYLHLHFGREGKSVEFLYKTLIRGKGGHDGHSITDKTPAN